MQGSKAYLVLENGEAVEGSALGAVGEVTGEVVFATGMTGHLRTLTDPGYYGQIVVQTFPLIGNYGIIPEEFESREPAVKGYIVKQWCQAPSNFRSEGELDVFLRSKGIVGLYGIDTRRLTKLIRQNGAMNGRITTDADDVPDNLADYRVLKAVAACSVKTAYTRRGGGKYRFAVLDFGLRESLLRALLRRAGEVTVFPHDTPAEKILAYAPGGIVLSGGPGDPRDAALAGVVGNIKKLCKSGVPVFGVGLGHQLLALAHRFEVVKLKHGHRGANQPAKDLISGRMHITEQNHGYAVVQDSVKPIIAREWMKNVNDGTNEGIIYNNAPVISVQFHPEPSVEPCDTSFPLEKFTAMMEEKK